MSESYKSSALFFSILRTNKLLVIYLILNKIFLFSSRNLYLFPVNFLFSFYSYFLSLYVFAFGFSFFIILEHHYFILFIIFVNILINFLISISITSFFQYNVYRNLKFFSSFKSIFLLYQAFFFESLLALLFYITLLYALILTNINLIFFDLHMFLIFVTNLKFLFLSYTLILHSNSFFFRLAIAAALSNLITILLLHITTKTTIHTITNSGFFFSGKSLTLSDDHLYQNSLIINWQ